MKIEVNVLIDLSENTKDFLRTLLNPGAIASAETVKTNVEKKKTIEEKSKVEVKEVKKAEPAVKEEVVETVETKSTETAIPVTVKTYTLQELGNAAKVLMDNGKREDLVELLASFGVKALTQLEPSKYNEFANKLRELGGDI